MMQTGALLSFGTLRGPAKLDAVTKLMDKLTEDLKDMKLSTQERDAALEELKIFGRDPTNADPIFTKQGLETLAKYAFESTSESTSRGALRILCNALLLKAETRQLFIDLGYEPKACEKLKNGTVEDEFLLSRLIFLTTYGTNVDLPKLIEQHHLAESIIQNLKRHAEQASTPKSGKAKVDPMVEMALGETLKLIFNVTRFATNHISSFDDAIPPIATILCSYELPKTSKTPLDPPFSLLINALMNLNLGSEAAKPTVYPANPDTPDSLVNRLLDLLDISMKVYSDDGLEQSVTPLVCVLQAVYQNAPAAAGPAPATSKGSNTFPDSPVRRVMRTRLLPTEEDRKQVLGKAETLPSRLLRNWSNPLAPEFRKSVAHLYFDISSRDPHQFVNNVGYGYASGFLFDNKIPVPPEAMKGDGTGEGSSINRPINPITGQFLDEESYPEIPPMTKEEKEREAERLFVLFERVKKSGVISVENPIEKAVQEGRFEELPDSDSESD